MFLNPDGHEWKRKKWSKPVRWYWKKSEELMVKHADMVVCDSKNIEKYIQYTTINPTQESLIKDQVCTGSYRGV